LAADRDDIAMRIWRARRAYERRLEKPEGAMRLVRQAIAGIRTVVDEALKNHPEILKTQPGDPAFEALAKHERTLAELGLMLERTQAEARQTQTTSQPLNILIGAQSDVIAIRLHPDAPGVGRIDASTGEMLVQVGARWLPSRKHERPELGLVAYEP